ncbi:latent-transforming growth factor beta-binding protein 4-like isoform X2 [Myxocyprinus asiaticus]|uniref:latent-transforming growth factor beta-binding protein 4-like isoform X2 n=1 Tax=Myxocyprinus asiaticus TaxID=70543 RepID=UPI00222354F4|nr:latent-transforming growth factor beta-binding protein 4-like isoform X2 [Myxocyprinus asiaticus]
MSELRRLSFCMSGSLFILSFAIVNLPSPSDQMSSHRCQHTAHDHIHPVQFRSKSQRHRHQTSSTRIQIDLKGPNVCGSRCCLSWLVNPKTRQCTKPRCHPRCHNKAVCRWPNICQCRPGFHGHRCEHASVTPTLSTWLEAQPGPITPSSVIMFAVTAVTTTTPVSATTNQNLSMSHSDQASRDTSAEVRKTYSSHWQPLSLKETQSVLLKRVLSSGTGGEKITSVILKYIESVRSRLESSSSDSATQLSSIKTFHTQHGQYTLIYTAANAQPSSSQRSSGVIRGGTERIKVLFTPTICKLRCPQGRCTNFCERGNVTTIYNSEQGGETPGSGFRVFLCPMLCKNGGVCKQKDQCLCPPNFTGKFCHIPVSTTSSNDIEKPLPNPVNSANQPMTSEYILPLQTPEQSNTNGSPMVKVRVQHPPEASVKIHQVLKVGYGPTVNEHSETVTWSAGLSGVQPRQLPGERAEALPPRIQAQTIRRDSVYTESSGFKYCFRDVRNGQCSSPLPGLRSQETCCRSVGMAWGINECTLCPPGSGNTVNGQGSCPKGFERINGTHCVAQKVISEEKDQCFRIVNQGSCSLPILRNITKQICCCSRVGKAWGKKCELCPHFGSAAFKEICPAGPGYHYSASALKFNQRLAETLGTGGPLLVSENGRTSILDKGSQPALPDSSRTHSTIRVQQPSSPETRYPRPTNTQTIRVQQPTRPQQPNTGSQSGSVIVITQPKPNLSTDSGSQTTNARPQQPSSVRPGNATTATSQPTKVITPVLHMQTSRPSVNKQPISPARALPVPATPRPLMPRQDTRVCESRSQVCGPGRCIDLPGGRHTCVCNTGYILNPQQGYCQDINECLLTPRPCSVGQCENTAGSFRCVCPSGYQTNSQQTQCIDVDECRQVPNSCINGRCENTLGSFRCVCRIGFELQENTCIDKDECVDPLRCNDQECVNTQGSYRCVSCKPGFDLLNGQCSDIDECRQTPSPCSEGSCENTQGSYRCACRTGYRPQANTCVDVDECDDPLKCSGQECVNSQGSYRCESCRPGFSLVNGRCSDVDECRQTPPPCSNGQCENTPGSFRCECRTGYKLQGTTCRDVNECEDPSQCPGQECVNSQGSYRCVSCRPGFGLKNGACSDIDECRQTPALCANGRCENTLGSYSCVCRSGFRLDGNLCIDVNECENEQCPGKACVNLVGSFKCVSCQPGFEVLNGYCQDIDECSQNHTRCTNGQCKNTPGSFRCVCDAGFRLEDSACTDIDECLDQLQCPGQQCVNSPGSYKCVPCRDGHSMQNGRCTDIDECLSTQICGSQSLCVNTDGSYRCDCLPGYRAAGARRQCRDINECLEGDFCFPSGECVNTDGSYKCVCAQGYKSSINGTSCQDVDECAQEGVCQDGRCTNTEGSFLCHCQTGFTTNPEKTACLDVNECEDSEGAVCGSQRCENTIGSFRCVTSCEPGYHITATGECVDINECANETVCGQHTFCQNLIGTYQCFCDQGYESTGDGQACVDINECETMQGVCGSARCWNVEGSFTCECENGLEEFEPHSGQCVNRVSSGQLGQSGGSSSSSGGRGSGGSSGSGSGSLPQARPGELRECYYGISQPYSCKILDQNTTLQECCCTVGQGWGLLCQYDICPEAGTVEFQSLCPNGRGYVTTETGAFSYKDVDECKLFDLEVCKGGVCVNNIPGYACYCSNGFYFEVELLECIDNNECDSEHACPDGTCVNTLGTFYCTCEPPLVLDDTQRNCINASGNTEDENLNFCWRHVTASLVCQSPLLGAQLTFTECCCLYGEAWGLQCALCPRRDEEAFEALCNELGPPPYSPRYYEPGPGRGGYLPPYTPPEYTEPLPGRPDYLPTDYDDYSPGGAGGRRSGLRSRPPTSYGLPDSPYRRPAAGSRYYEEEDYETAPGPPFGVPDPRSERAFEARPLPARPEGLPLSLAPLPDNSPYSEGEEEETWRAPPPFPIFPDRREGPQRVYERRYEPYGSLSSEECGILQGCENGRCIRVAEGYTCDCYDGYQLDITTMNCTDVDECEEEDTIDCINGRCVNTEGSYRCVCLRGFIMSRRPNHCIPA